VGRQIEILTVPVAEIDSPPSRVMAEHARLSTRGIGRIRQTKRLHPPKNAIERFTIGQEGIVVRLDGLDVVESRLTPPTSSAGTIGWFRVIIIPLRCRGQSTSNGL
jgi:hypothetical protein